MVISGTSTMSGSITGKRFQVDDLSRISVSGKGVNFIPGTTAGTPSSSPDATKFAIYS